MTTLLSALVVNENAQVLLAFATLITASMGAYAVWRKLKPETTSIQITSANTLTEIAVKAGEFVEAQRDDLAEQVAALRKEVNDLRKSQETAEGRAKEAAVRAEKSENLVTELREELDRREKARVEREQQLSEDASRQIEDERKARRAAESREAEHAAEVRRLWVIVHGLRELLRESGMEIPEQLQGGIGETFAPPVSQGEDTGPEDLQPAE